MLHPRALIEETTTLVEKSKEAGHLLMSGDFKDEYRELDVQTRIKMQEGFTTHPAFIKLESFVNCYRLKAGYSASQALKDLLTEYVMVVDSGLAQLLVYYVSILNAMQRMHGKIEGANRFDHFFGSDMNEVPENRRLLLSPEGPLMGTHKMPVNKSMQALPLQPLSFVFELIETPSKQIMASFVEFNDNQLISLFITPLDRLEMAYKAYAIMEDRKIEQVLNQPQVSLLAQAMRKLEIESEAIAAQAAQESGSVSQTFTPQASSAPASSIPASASKEDEPKPFVGSESGFLKNGL